MDNEAQGAYKGVIEKHLCSAGCRVKDTSFSLGAFGGGNQFICGIGVVGELNDP